MEAKINLFITRELTGKQHAFATRLGINPIMRSAIQVDINQPDEADSHWARNDTPTPWVFTSKNGVEGFRRYARMNMSGFAEDADNTTAVREKPVHSLPTVYAVGEKTADALADLGLTALIPGREDAKGLAALIIANLSKEDQTESVIHWCGNRSRRELGKLLSDAGIELQRRVVYSTSLNRIELPEEPIEGILFFSPSAVEAFRFSGGFSRPLPPLFAVGQTTAQALSLESGATIHVPDRPSTENLLELAVNVLKSASSD